MNNFWFVARKPFNCTFKMFKSLALGASKALHFAAIGAGLFTWSFHDQWCATFCAIRLHGSQRVRIVTITIARLWTGCLVCLQLNDNFILKLLK
jgi:hypothetical protein